jgi:hypothetical protein
MNFKQALDKYLTTEPDNLIDVWYDKTIDAIDNEIFEKHEDFILSEAFTKTIDLIYLKGRLPAEGAAIIERILKYK